MGKSEQYITVSVFNLASTTTKNHVEDFFGRHIANSEPVVSQLVQRLDKRQTTTITIKGTSGNALREIVKSFKQPGFDKSPLNAEAGFSSSFLGLTTLYESSSEPPAFDFYFVHGLGGHAFNTWASKPEHHAQVCMWPRDILPAYLERERDGQEQLYGRYSTFGYDSSVKSGKEMKQSIPETAGELLNAIAVSRSGNVPMNTPIFFICHSLGGLVTCQAIVTILSKKEHRENFDVSLLDRFLHKRHHKCLVRGIAFFGTPFDGSWLANLAAPLVRLRYGNGTFVSALKVKDRQVQNIKEDFDEVRKDLQNRIRLVIFFEKKEMAMGTVKTFVVTEKHSALSTFDEKVDQQPLLLDHRNIVKFIHESDRDFQQFVGPLVLNMVQSGLNEMKDFDLAHRPQVDLGRALSRRPGLASKIAQIVPAAGEDQTEEPETRTSALPQKHLGLKGSDNVPRWELLRFGRSSEVEKVLQILLEGVEPDNTAIINKQLEQIKDPIGDTCDWILNQDLYNEWEDAVGDNVLFFMGKEGSGKSVLAKYIINRITQGKPGSTIASFFCRSIGTTSTPANILRHVILQLERQNPDLILKSLFDRPISSFVGHYDVNVLWTLFRDMCEKIEGKVFVVIDGLDECLQNIKLKHNEAPSGVDPTRQFLEQICGLMATATSQSDSPESSGASKRLQTSICFLTRPQNQVNDATREINCVIMIDPSEVQERAVQLIDSEVSRLVAEEKLPSDLEQVVKKNLMEKAKATPESAFQWANTAIERMQNETGSTNEKLDAIHPGLYPVYIDILKQISGQKDVEDILSFVFQTLVFAQADLSFDALEHAMDLNYDPEKNERAMGMTRIRIRDIIEQVRGLINVENDVLRISHESVREFFLQLSVTAWPKFSCKNARECHTKLALLCIRYLSNWHRGSVPKRDTEGNLSEEAMNQILKTAQASKRPFIDYALELWAVHTRESGTPSKKLLSALGYLLREEEDSYQLTLTLEDYKKGYVFDLNGRHWQHPTVTLARHNLTFVLKEVKNNKNGESPRISRSLLARLHSNTTKNTSRANLSVFNFQLDANEKNHMGMSLLHCAAANGSLEMVTYLLDHGAKGNVFDLDGHTPFSLAVQIGQVSTAELLIQRDHASERKSDREKFTSLHLACIKGMTNVVRYCLKYNTDTNIRVGDEQWTPLHCAAQEGSEDSIKMLLEHGANAMLKKNRGLTALHLAASKGHLGACRRLLDAMPIQNIDCQSEDGETPIYLAAQNGHEVVVKFLLSKGATLVVETIDGYSPVHIAAARGHETVIDLLATKDNVDDRTSLSWQAIHLASHNGHVHIVRRLIKLGADPDSKMRDLGDLESKELTITPIILAIEKGYEVLTRMLLNFQVPIGHFRRFNNENILHSAARGGSVVITRWLMETGHFDAFERADTGNTPFHTAAEEGNDEIMNLFWDFSPKHIRDIDITDDRDLFTPLLLAAESVKSKTIDFCLRHGANPNRVDSRGWDAINLLVSFSKSHEDVTQILQSLIDSGASVNSTAKNGETALHAAADSGKESLVEVLLRNKADVHAVDIHGASPLHAAAHCRDSATFSLLLKWGANPLLIDHFGNTPLDVIAGYQPIAALPELEQCYARNQPLAVAEKNYRVCEVIRQQLTQNITLNQLQSARTILEGQWSLDIAVNFFFIGREDDTRISVEHSVERRMFGSYLTATCSKCKEAYKKAPFRVCRDCRPVWILICNTCYSKYKDDDVFRGCSKDHSQLEIAGTYWSELKPGTVRKDGLTMEKWRDNLRKEFGVEMPQSSEDVKTSAGQPEQAGSRLTEVDDDAPEGE